MIARENHSLKQKSHKLKSKNKTKPKSNYLQQGFLDMLIQLKNLQVSNKKVKNNRTNKKTLPVFIPENQKKILKRPHTSYEKYSKPHKNALQNSNKINLQEAFTEEDNIEFTQLTPRQSFHEDYQQSVYIEYKINRDFAAIKIQRAWRNYQVYQMISKYKKFFSRESKSLAPIVVQQNNSAKVRHRRTPAQINNQYRQQRLNKSSQSLLQLQIKKHNKNSLQDIGKNCTYSPVNLITDEYVGEMERTLKKMPSINITNQEFETPESPVNQLDSLMKRKLEKSPKTNPNIQALLNSIESKLSDNMLQQNIKQLMQKINENKQNIGQILVNSPHSDIEEQQQITKPQQQILNKRKQLLKNKLEKKLNQYEEKLNEGHISLEQYLHKKQLYLKKYNAQFKNIAKSRKLLSKYYNSFENNLISFQKESSSSSSQLRKTFSAESIVFKSILKDIQINKFQIEENIQQCVQLNQQQIIQFNEKSHSNLDIDSPTLQKTKIQSKEKITNEMIQAIYEEFICEIFLDNKMYKKFQPYIESGFTFPKIEDYHIQEFLNQIKGCFPQFKTIHKRLNQRLNPSSLQILKILRNADYNPDQYVLVLEQQCFKQYKKQLETYYNQKKKKQIQTLKPIENVQKFQLRIKLYEMTHDKIQRIKKLLTFQKDLKAMYMKSIFNCLNEFFIQAKSFSTFMNARSSIGPGELSLALKQYNKYSNQAQVQQIMDYCFEKIKKIVHYKIEDPVYGMNLDIQRFQEQICKIISMQMQQTQYKWVNYMDETLQIWLELSIQIQAVIMEEVAMDILIFL